MLRATARIPTVRTSTPLQMSVKCVGFPTSEMRREFASSRTSTVSNGIIMCVWSVESTMSLIHRHRSADSLIPTARCSLSRKFAFSAGKAIIWTSTPTYACNCLPFAWKLMIGDSASYVWMDMPFWPPTSACLWVIYPIAWYSPIKHIASSAIMATMLRMVCARSYPCCVCSTMNTPKDVRNAMRMLGWRVDNAMIIIVRYLVLRGSVWGVNRIINLEVRVSVFPRSMTLTVNSFSMGSARSVQTDTISISFGSVWRYRPCARGTTQTMGGAHHATLGIRWLRVSASDQVTRMCAFGRRGINACNVPMATS